MMLSAGLPDVISGFASSARSFPKKVVDAKKPSRHVKANKKRFMLIPPNGLLFDVLNGIQTPFDKRLLLI